MKKNLPVHDLSLFINADDEQGFYTNKLSSHVQQHKFVTLPHKHSFYMVVVCTQGRGIHTIDFESYEIKPGSLFFLIPGQMHYWTTTEELEGYVFFHSREFYDLNYVNKRINDYPFYYCSYNCPATYLKPNETQHIESIFLELIDEFRGDALGKYPKMCSLVDLMYIDLSRIYLGEKRIVKPSDSYSSKIRQLEGLIDKNFRTIKSPVKYAEMMHVSAKQLNRICKMALNKTTSDLITERVILEAKRMLVYGILNINEIADDLGYFDAAYFTRIFKKHTSKTPMQFMERCRKEMVIA